jgi:hypothetical protein
VAVVDPGMVADRRLILGPLTELGIEPRRWPTWSSAITTRTTP